ncbi:MAG: UV DNA damage repair endonuclease UvsE [Nitrososphaerota archaeon]
MVVKLRVGLGFFCSTSDNRLSTNHRIKLRSLSEDRLLEVFKRNLDDLMKLLDLSRRMGLTIFRLGSNFIPFASHTRFNRGWFKAIERILREAADRVRGYGIRITMHPGQYVVLNSPNENVIMRSLAELRYHFWVLDTLGLGDESLVVVHVGGVYGDKMRALKRFEETVENNKWLTRRLALENDERHYTMSEVIEISESLGLPAVLDYYHHTLNPSKFSMDRLVSTWRNIVPETHLSSAPQRAHRFGEHGDYVEVRDFKNLISLFLGERAIDIIVEAKKKEKAISRLLEELRGDEVMRLITLGRSGDEGSLLVQA